MKEVLNTEEELSYSMTSAPPTVLGNSPYAVGYTDYERMLKQFKKELNEIQESV